MAQEASAAVPNKPVVWGAGLLLLSLAWGFGTLQLDARQLMPAADQ